MIINVPLPNFWGIRPLATEADPDKPVQWACKKCDVWGKDKNPKCWSCGDGVSLLQQNSPEPSGGQRFGSVNTGGPDLSGLSWQELLAGDEPEEA